MRVYITRHGETEYRQGIVSLGEADDLTNLGRDTVVMSAIDAANNMKINGITKTRIKSSPYGRTLFTAKLWECFLRICGIETPNIEICPELTEIKNLDYPGLLSKLIAGGEISYSDGKFVVYPNESNPEKYPPYCYYFRRDCMHKLPEGFRKKLPREITDKIDATETFVDATKRFKDVLGSLDSQVDAHVLVCHEGYTGEFVEMAAEKMGFVPYLDRGKYFVLEKHDKLWVPIHVQEGAIQYER
jgi:broad specificity phosphatase PhoE